MSCHHMQKLSRACKQVGLVSLDDDLLAALLYLRDRVIPVRGDTRGKRLPSPHTHGAGRSQGSRHGILQ